jgi:hypothetical protein
MKRRRGSDRCVRAALRSSGWPREARRENCRQFWVAIASGRSSDDAAVDAGVSPTVGVRWFRKVGGMRPTHFSQSSKPVSGRYLSFAEREEIAILRAQGHGVGTIARQLNRPPCTISRGVLLCDGWNGSLSDPRGSIEGGADRREGLAGNGPVGFGCPRK